jgi:hypothetical protein
MGACLNLDSAIEVSAEKKLRLRYALWVHDGIAPQHEIEAIWEKFTALPQVELTLVKK